MALALVLSVLRQTLELNLFFKDVQLVGRERIVHNVIFYLAVYMVLAPKPLNAHANPVGAVSTAIKVNALA